MKRTYFSRPEEEIVLRIIANMSNLADYYKLNPTSVLFRRFVWKMIGVVILNQIFNEFCVIQIILKYLDFRIGVHGIHGNLIWEIVLWLQQKFIKFHRGKFGSFGWYNRIM